MPYDSASAQYWYRVKKVRVFPARSRKSCIVQAVRQVVFTDVLIVGRLDVDGQQRPLLRPTSVNFWQYCRNLSHATVPLNCYPT